MREWRDSFVEKLGKVQNQWNKRFDEAMENTINPVFDEFAAFLRTNGFHVSQPMKQEDRRSFKFELAENAYLLLIFRSTAIGEFETRCECFVPGNDPMLSKSIGRLADVDESWTRKFFQSSLDVFIEQLASQTPRVSEELAMV
ncbi:MAG: hypothetical protein AB7Q17_06715 [Phycisphaerae bacterium]